MKIAVFVGSIRSGRYGRVVGQWAVDQLRTRGDGHTYELLDLAEQDLDQLTSATLPMMAEGRYDEPKTAAWAGKVSGYDGYIFVTPEYNASVPGTMKNAFDLLKVEWEGKPVGFLSYGGGGGVRAVSHWRDIVANVGMHALDAQVSLTFADHFPEYRFTPGEEGAQLLDVLAEELSAALRGVAVEA